MRAWEFIEGEFVVSIDQAEREFGSIMKSALLTTLKFLCPFSSRTVGLNPLKPLKLPWSSTLEVNKLPTVR